MIASLTRTKFLAVLFLIGALIAAGAHAQDERASGTYVKAFRADNTLIAPPPAAASTIPAHQSINSIPPSPTVESSSSSAAYAPAKTTPVPTKANAVPPPPGKRTARSTAPSSISAGDLSKTESFGTLQDAGNGGLGIDMWDGSSRAFITTLIPQMPNSLPYRTPVLLVRRVLTTAADTSMLSGGSPAPGHDLLTLRIRKLMEMGALDDAAALYRENPLPPYDAAQADAGAMALMADGQSALACLDTKAFASRFSGDASWQRTNSLCNYLLGRLNDHAAPLDTDSAVLKQLSQDASYRYPAHNAHDLESLTPFERIALIASHRVDYSQLGSVDGSSLTPLTLSMIVHDTSAPITLRYNLLLAGARVGIFKAEDIGKFYQAIPFANLAQPGESLSGGGETGWQHVAWIYASAIKQNGQIDKPALQAAFAERGTVGLTALWPFVKILDNVDPAGMGADSVRTGVLIALITDTSVPSAWSSAFFVDESGEKQDQMIKLSLALMRNQSDSAISHIDDFDNVMKGLNQHEQLLITVMMETLDKGQKFHKVSASQIDVDNVASQNGKELTQDNRYGLAITELGQDLLAAENDRRLGETVLLSSMALSGAPPDKLSAGTFRQALTGYQISGLTKESRELATEVALDLK